MFCQGKKETDEDNYALHLSIRVLVLLSILRTSYELWREIDNFGYIFVILSKIFEMSLLCLLGILKRFSAVVVDMSES